MDQSEQNVVQLPPKDGGAPPPKTAARRSPSRFIPTDRMAFTKQVDTLRGFAILFESNGGSPVTNAEVGKLLGITEATVQLTNPFNVASELLQRVEGGFIPSQEVVAFKRAHEWSPETAGQKLAPAIRRTWYAKVVLAKLGMGPIPEDDAIRLFADESNAEPKHRPQLRTMLEFMEVAGLIKREDGMIRGNVARPTSEGVPEGEPEPEKKVPPAPSKQQPGVSSVFTSSDTEGLVRFDISVRVAMSEFAGWDPARISAFFSGIAEVLAAKSGVEREEAS